MFPSVFAPSWAYLDTCVGLTPKTHVLCFSFHSREGHFPKDVRVVYWGRNAALIGASHAEGWKGAAVVALLAQSQELEAR